ncbi:MAG: 3-phosphoshikimate 1-carboxyvinyltransferase [Alphaproteobacteria bacterium]
MSENAKRPAKALKSGALNGTVRAPGDKSISHRAIIFGGLASGETTVSGLLEGEDILSTVGAMRAFGANIRKDGDMWHIAGCGEAGLQTPEGDIDCGNAGTGVRLIMGAAAGYGVTATYTGDSSLRSRPMGRIVDPLAEMGVSAETQDGGRLPATLSSKPPLTAIDYTPKQASAQVKSAVLLAGLRAKGKTTVREPRPSRDHTENMLRAFGVPVESKTYGEGQVVSLTGPAALTATHVNVPGDPSSAAFPIVAALITPGSDVTIENVMMNPTRIGLFETLTEMGADLKADNFRKSGGEIIADIRVRHSKLRGITVPPQRAPSMIDEYPILAVAAAFAMGTTHMPGIHELRVKESDRIAATAALLRENGVSVKDDADSLTVVGGAIAGGPVKGGATVVTYHDHRIAMSALVLGLNADAPVSVDDASMIATSFPEFFDMMKGLGAKIEASS